VNANGSAQLTRMQHSRFQLHIDLEAAARAFRIAANRQGIKTRRDRERLLLICYGKSLDTLRTELQDSMPPVSLGP
jgi:hypothetical protein